MVVYQCIMDGRTAQNEEFLGWKRQSVVDTGHSGLWQLGKIANEDGYLEQLIASGKMHGPAGGSFPIRVNGELVATLSVPGFENGDDQWIIWRAVSQIPGRPCPEYSGPML